MEDTLKLIEDRENELHAVYERMDAIQDELYLAYAMKDFDGKTLLKNVVNVSLNSSLVLRNNTIADLEGTIFQWQFEGDKSLTEHKEDLLRGFVQDSLDQADEQLLQTKGITSLKSWFCHKVVEEVLLGVMWITNPPIDGEANFECLPLRMRWCPFDYDNRGLAWIAPKYTRSGAQIMAEYGGGVKRTFTGKSFDVVNFWDREKNQIYVNKELIFEQPNVFKEVPANIVLPVLGLALEETDKRETDVLHDVFFANKRIVEELNRSVSIAQTKAMETVKPAMIENKENPDAAPADPPPGMGEVKQGKMGPRPVWEALQKPDINQAFQYGQAIISKAAQQGGINDIDLGNVNPAASSLVVTAQAGIRQKFNRTSIEALEVMYRGLARLMIAQNQQYDKLKVGRKGIRHTYSLGAIGTDYSIQCRHMTKTKELEIANEKLKVLDKQKTEFLSFFFKIFLNRIPIVLSTLITSFGDTLVPKIELTCDIVISLFEGLLFFG